jgi:hypothetical protein
MNLNEKRYLLTFEVDAKNEMLEIHANQKGLEKLKGVIDSLLSRSDCDHVHLMTTEWGGDELSSEKQNQENEIINHVKIFKWVDNE